MKKTIAFITAFLITVTGTGSVRIYAADSQTAEVTAGQNETADSSEVSENETEDEEADTSSDEETEPSEDSESENEDESSEITGPDEFVKRIYRTALEREADEGGLDTWLGHLNSDRMTASDVVRCIVTSPEYNRKEKSDSEYAAMLYFLMTGEEASEEDNAALADRLSAGYSRAELVRVLETNEKFSELCEKYGVKRGGKNIHEGLSRFAESVTAGEHEAEMLAWKLQDGNITAAEVLQDYFAGKIYADGENGIKEYISELYTCVLVRDEAPESGVEHWSKYLKYGMSDRFVLRGFVHSEEFRIRCGEWGINSGSIVLSESRDTNAGVTDFVQNLYSICLGRRADINGLNTWTGHINSGRMTASDVVKSIVTSREYNSKNTSDEEYISMLFRLFRDRDGEETEIKELVEETLAKGHTREAVLRRMSFSEEFSKMCSDKGIVRGEIKVGGWSRNDGGFKCYISPDTGKMVTGNQIVTGIHCYFDSDGSLRTDWSDLKTVVNTSAALYSYTDMVEDVVTLQQQYPSLVQINTIGSTADGRQIYDMMIGSPDAARQIVIQAGCHGREYMGSQMLMAQSERFLKNYWSGTYDGRSYSTLLEDYCIHIIPMMNPDGITISQFGLNGIRNVSIQSRIRNIYSKDYAEGVTRQGFDAYLRSWKSNALGVDLNRNFDSDWAGQNEIGRPSQTGYPGPFAASENEVKAVTGLVESLSDVQSVISYHSSGSYIYWAYGQTGEFRTACSDMADGLRNITGYYLISQDNYGGGCSNWAAGRGYRAATIEIGTGESPLPISQLASISDRNKDVIPYLLSMPLYNAKEIKPTKAPEYVRHLYNTVLGREPDENGWKFWTARIANKKSTPADEIRLFTESTEFMNKGYSDEEFIDIAYAAFCGREPSSEEREYRLYMLSEGYSRNYILCRLSESDEYAAMCDEYGIHGGEVMLNGWQKETDGTFYYQNGIKVCREIRNLDGYTYYFDENGHLGNGWYTISGKRYYVADGFLFPSNGTDWGTEFSAGNVRRDSGKAVKMDIPLDFQFLYNRVICRFGGVDKTVNSSGCGAASASMVIRYLTGSTQYDPETLFEWAYRNGEYYGYGLAESTVSKFLEMAGIKNYWIQPSASEVTAALKEGNPVIALVREGYFTTGGHYIVLTGVTDDGYITVNDPNNSTICRFEFRLDSVVNQAKCFMICGAEKP